MLAVIVWWEAKEIPTELSIPSHAVFSWLNNIIPSPSFQQVNSYLIFRSQPACCFFQEVFPDFPQISPMCSSGAFFFLHQRSCCPVRFWAPFRVLTCLIHSCISRAKHSALNIVEDKLILIEWNKHILIARINRGKNEMRNIHFPWHPLSFKNPSRFQASPLSSSKLLFSTRHLFKCNSNS